LSGEDLARSTLSSEDAPNSAQWVEFDFDDITVVPGDTYYIVWHDLGGSSGDFFYWGAGADNPYENGNAWIFNRNWLVFDPDNTPDADFCFKTYGYNTTPTADFTWHPIPPLVNEIVTFDASGSYDDDGNITSYEWDFDNDGNYDDATGKIAEWSWNARGSYTVSLKVTDNERNAGTKTKIISVIENHAPNKPMITGPISAKVGTEYTYSSSTTDSDRDQVYYLFDWGDGTDSGWLGPYDSGVGCSASHVWNSEGDYEIKVLAKDTYGVTSEWSDPLPVSMPLKHQTILERIWELILEIFENTIP
jgi:chitodextrinase